MEDKYWEAQWLIDQLHRELEDLEAESRFML